MMATPLTPAEANRVINLLSRLASDHDGERAAAGMLVTRLIKGKGLQWSDLIQPALTYAPPLPETEMPHHWRRQATRCLACEDLLTAWEISFLNSVLYRSRQDFLTAKQLETLDTITANIARRGRP